MDVTLLANNVAIPDRFRDYVSEKSEKVHTLVDSAQTFHVKVSRENSSRGPASEDVVELTVLGKGPIIRAEAKGADKYVAFDEALGHLIKRLRRAKDKKMVHHGQQRQESFGELSATGFSEIDVTPADVELIRSVATGSIPAMAAEDPLGNGTADESPVVIRRKVFEPLSMSAEDAVDHMELVGHDFFLYIDLNSSLPSVVYRRKGWDYGVISLGE